MDIQKELNLLLQKVGKIVPTMVFIGTTTDKCGAFMMGSPEDTDEKRKIDLTATVAMMMDQRKELCEVLFSAVCWSMQENPKYQEAMQTALDKLKELADGHQRTAERE